ncbi:unnamed protein product [Alopecurus aequalis]
MVPHSGLLVIIFLWWLPPMLVGAQLEEQQQRDGRCTRLPKTCGKLNISDPFWLQYSETGRSCGFLDFEVTCIDNITVLPSVMPLSYGFAILDISYENKSMRVADLGKLRLFRDISLERITRLPTSDSCNKPMWNTSEKLHHYFSIDPVNQNLAMYNCTKASTAARRDGELVETKMSCGNESQVFVSVEGTYGDTSTIEGCRPGVILPVLASADGEVNASDYEQLISEGFILRWEIPPLAPHHHLVTAAVPNLSYSPMASRCWFLVLAWVWWLPLMLVPAEELQQGRDCPATASCGNLTIAHPFWLVDVETGSSSCGSQDFVVACYNKTPFLRGYGVVGFEIIEISYENNSMLAVDLAKRDLVHATNSCDANTNWNTSVKLGPQFRIDPGNLDLIFYNCKNKAAATARLDPAVVDTGLRCGNESEVLVRAAGSYSETSEYPGYAVEGCDALVMPVLGSSSGEANASDYKRLIAAGFMSTWKSPRKFTRLHHLSFRLCYAIF